MSTRIRPLNNFVIVELDKVDEQTAGGLYIPERARLKKQTGTVRAVGRGLVTETGTIVPPQTKPGDRVYVLDPPGGLRQVEHNGVACVALPDEGMLLGIIEGEESSVVLE